MRKVFLYLYPVKEYFYDCLKNVSVSSLKVLNECIEKRYREKGYEVIFVAYPDREIYGVEKKDEDDVAYTDLDFHTFYYTKNSDYPSVDYVLDQVGKVDKLVIGGFHGNDCVKRFALHCYYQRDIDTLIDIDLTEMFFYLHTKKEYFKIDEYNPYRYKKFLKSKDNIMTINYDNLYVSPIYGMDGVKRKR